MLQQHQYFGSGYPWIIAALPALLAARGIAVFMPNPRGSFGWGNAFAESVAGDMGGQDADDLLRGLDACLEGGGELDGARIGIGGWSYGGYMAAWLVTRTPRFKAALVGAGITNWRSFYGTSVLGPWARIYMVDDPYRIGGDYDLRSPVIYASQVVTPTLLVGGSADEYVPIGQAAEYHTALQAAGCYSELEVFEGAGHHLATRESQLAFAERVIGWYERWL
jgi:dipeptidyl aminopeptidase/acylaminoacyl peptidase